MDSGYRQQPYEHHFQEQQQQQQQRNSGLTRFRSAPSSYFSSFLDEKHDFSNTRPLSPETENIFARFMSSMGDESEANPSPAPKLCDIPENSAVNQEFLVEVKQERDTLQQQNLYQQHYQQQMVFKSQSKPPLVNQKISGIESSFGSAANSTRMRLNNSNSGLTRHSSSPADFFNSILDMDDGFGVMKGMQNYGASNPQTTNFSQGQCSSTTGLMTQNADVAGRRFNNSSNDDSNYISGYPMNSWDDSVIFENFSTSETSGGEETTHAFSGLKASENQSGEGRNRPPVLAHHLSLPSNSTMEKMLQFQDTVPCKIRAKRGCATHPRSIAERVRRTRISERMRKLQDLVPSMDKQTNTADMLDLAVEYIKDLQNQVRSLNDKREKCTCPR